MVHSSSMAVGSCWVLAGTGTRCCIHIIYVSYPEHPKHAQWVTCPVSMLAMQELATIKGHSKMLNSVHRQQLWWTFLQSACQLHAPSKVATSVALCCVIKLHISVAFYSSQPKAHLCNMHAV